MRLGVRTGIKAQVIGSVIDVPAEGHDLDQDMKTPSSYGGGGKNCGCSEV